MNLWSILSCEINSEGKEEDSTNRLPVKKENINIHTIRIAAFGS